MELTVAEVAHVVQVALTPVFLLSGIAALLNVFATRLARVADQVDALALAAESASAADAARLHMRLDYLRRRSLTLDVAVILATIGSVSTGLAILALFVGALRDSPTAWTLFVCFGFAIVCTVGALIAFLKEALMAGRSLRIHIAAQQREAGRK